MPRIPDDDEFARLWGAMATSDRRRIVRSVNRGELLDSRKEAALAVVLARRQQRFWRVAWLLGPLVAAPLSLALDVGGALAIAGNAILGAAVLIAMSAFWTRRTRRAEELNLDHAVHGRRRPQKD